MIIARDILEHIELGKWKVSPEGLLLSVQVCNREAEVQTKELTDANQEGGERAIEK